MLTIKQCWDELVRQTVKTRKFQSVKALPLHRVADADFLKRFPGLKLPACLIVFLGRTGTARGAALDRVCRWSAVIVDKDAGGDAWENAVNLVDDFEDNVLDEQYLDDELTVYASADVGVADSNPRFAIYEVSFTTREAAER